MAGVLTLLLSLRHFKQAPILRTSAAFTFWSSSRARFRRLRGLEPYIVEPVGPIPVDLAHVLMNVYSGFSLVMAKADREKLTYSFSSTAAV